MNRHTAVTKDTLRPASLPGENCSGWRVVLLPTQGGAFNGGAPSGGAVVNGGAVGGAPQGCGERG
jgi:hypothetical protein